MSIRMSLCVLLLAVAGTAGAQPATTPQQPAASAKPAVRQLTPEQRQAIIKFRKAMVANATAIVGLIDSGHEGQVWDNASEAMKKTASRDAFIEHVKKERKAVGNVESRRPVRLYRTTYPTTQNNVPPGNYFTVRFLTRFANAKGPLVEVVSYHYDTPTTLRLSGYTIQKPAARRAAAPAAARH